MGYSRVNKSASVLHPRETSEIRIYNSTSATCAHPQLLCARHFQSVVACIRDIRDIGIKWQGRAKAWRVFMCCTPACLSTVVIQQIQSHFRLFMLGLLDFRAFLLYRVAGRTRRVGLWQERKYFSAFLFSFFFLSSSSSFSVPAAQIYLAVQSRNTQYSSNPHPHK